MQVVLELLLVACRKVVLGPLQACLEAASLATGALGFHLAQLGRESCLNVIFLSLHPPFTSHRITRRKRPFDNILPRLQDVLCSHYALGVSLGLASVVYPAASADHQARQPPLAHFSKS